MRFIPIGITTEADIQPVMNASDYSDDKYEGFSFATLNRTRWFLLCTVRSLHLCDGR